MMKNLSIPRDDITNEAELRFAIGDPIMTLLGTGGVCWCCGVYCFYCSAKYMYARTLS